MKKKALTIFAMLVVICMAGLAAQAQSSAFTYQGRLAEGGAAANGSYDLQFTLFDSASGGTQVGATQTSSGVTVTNGVFTVQLDFGAGAFPGAQRFLEIGVRTAGGGSFTSLAPRHRRQIAGWVTAGGPAAANHIARRA